MAPTPSITNIENQIAKIAAALEKARTSQYAAAEKAFVAAQNRAAAAQAKVKDLVAKGGTTATAQNRLNLAKAALIEQENLLAAAQEQFDAAKAVKDAADEVAQILAGKKPGKKIKFTKKEKKVMKEDKKEAKKQEKQDKKNEKQKVKDEKKAAKQIKKDAKKAGKNTSPEKTASEQPAEATKNVSAKASTAAKPKAKAPVAKKPVAKQPRAKKVPEAAVAAETQAQTQVIKPKDLEPTQASLPAHITAENTPEGTSAEPAASETGKDILVETQVVPPAEIAPEESAQEDNLDKPIND